MQNKNTAFIKLTARQKCCKLQYTKKQMQEEATPKKKIMMHSKNRLKIQKF